MSEMSPIPADRLAAMIDPATTALAVIDAQNDFVSADGVLGRAGLDMTPLQPALANVERLIGEARAAGVTVAMVRVVTRPQSDSQALKLLMQRRGHGDDALELCRVGTPGVDYYPTIIPMDGDIQIQKLLYSSFSGTDFELQLRARGIETLVIVGFTTDCCVDSTARDAFHRNFNVFIVTDACAAYDAKTHDAAVDLLVKNAALPVLSADVETVWRGRDAEAVAA